MLAAARLTAASTRWPSSNARAAVRLAPGPGGGAAAGKDLGEERTDALIGVVRAAAANSGHVSDPAWARAVGRGWSDEQLAEAFAYLGLAVFTSYFLNYADTELDIPAALPGSSRQ